MRFGGSWAGLNPGNQNYLSALWGRPAPIASAPVQPSAPTAPIKQVVPQTKFKPLPPPTITRTMVSQPETQTRSKARVAPGNQPGTMGQTQNTMAPGGNQSAFGNQPMRAFKKGGAVTTSKVSTSSKNKSQPKW